MSFHKSVLGRGSDWGHNDHTLADYIRRKNKDEAFTSVANEKKMTFSEFFLKQSDKLIGQNTNDFQTNWWNIMKTVWSIAQENK